MWLVSAFCCRDSIRRNPARFDTSVTTQIKTMDSRAHNVKPFLKPPSKNMSSGSSLPLMEKYVCKYGFNHLDQ